MENHTARYVLPFCDFPARQVLCGIEISIRSLLLDRWESLTEDEIGVWAGLVGGLTQRVFERQRMAHRDMEDFLDWVLEQRIARTLAQEGLFRESRDLPLDTHPVRFHERAILPVVERLEVLPWYGALDFVGRLVGTWMRTCPVQSVTQNGDYDQIARRFRPGNGGFTQAYGLEHLPAEEQRLLFVLMYVYTHGGETGGL